MDYRFLLPGIAVIALSGYGLIWLFMSSFTGFLALILYLFMVGFFFFSFILLGIGLISDREWK